MKRLRDKIRSLEGGSYKQYKSLVGEYRFPGFMLCVDHVQGDPFALPSRVSAHIPHQTLDLPPNLWSNPHRQRACEDYLARAVHRLIAGFVSKRRGSGRSGEVGIAVNGQQALKRNSVQLHENGLEVRITVGLPADGRRVLASEAEKILCDDVPKVIEGALLYENMNASDIEAHVCAIEDQAVLRSELDENNLVGFIADGSRLPRRSGIDDRPQDTRVIPVDAPESLAVELELPNSGRIRGLGIPEGVTLIVGGGFHGKSTLLHALERGVYDHIPGDGRERAVTRADAMKVRAEDGRSIARLDISAFINHLPFDRDTVCFSTDNASGSTSQAANIIEALHSGSKLLLIDEDTSATNFMIRDARMQKLVADDKEPISPFITRVRELYDTHGISSVIVMGGSGDYLSVADTVIMLDNYEIRDVTGPAHELAGGPPQQSNSSAVSLHADRRPRLDSLSARRNNKDKIASYQTRELIYGKHEVDVSKLEQLVDQGQLEAIGWMLYRLDRDIDQQLSAVEMCRQLIGTLHEQGLDAFTPYERVGNFAVPRLQELLATLNRIRGIAWLD